VNGDPTTTVDVYDAPSNQWFELNLLEPRYEPAAVAL